MRLGNLGNCASFGIYNKGTFLISMEYVVISSAAKIGRQLNHRYFYLNLIFVS